MCALGSKGVTVVSRTTWQQILYKMHKPQKLKAKPLKISKEYSHFLECFSINHAASVDKVSNWCSSFRIKSPEKADDIGTRVRFGISFFAKATVFDIAIIVRPSMLIHDLKMPRLAHSFDRFVRK